MFLTKILGFMVIAAANLCHPWLVFKCSLCIHAPAISGAFITRTISSVVFQSAAVSTCCNYETILASGAIVEDEQLQCQLQAVMLCHCISQHMVQLWKMSSVNGAIVEDEQLQCSLQAVMLCYGMSQQVVQLWKMSNCSANNVSPFPLARNVKVQGSIGSHHPSSLYYHLPICLL